MVNSRRKGHQWERDVAELVRPFWTEAKRGLGQTRGAEVPDVDGTPYWLECKKGKQVNLRAAYRQAAGDTDGRVPVVIARDDGEPPMVYMRLDHWLSGGSDGYPLTGGQALDCAMNGLEVEAYDGDAFRTDGSTYEWNISGDSWDTVSGEVWSHAFTYKSRWRISGGKK